MLRWTNKTSPKIKENYNKSQICVNFVSCHPVISACIKQIIFFHTTNIESTEICCFQKEYCNNITINQDIYIQLSLEKNSGGLQDGAILSLP